MKKPRLTLCLITIFLLGACNNPEKTKKFHNKHSFDTLSEQISKPYQSSLESIFNHDKDLINILIKAINIYPDDSSSIMDFYARISSKNSLENKKHIKRIEGLISKNNVEMYYLVHKNLRPLMNSIINSDTVSISQGNEFAKYFSFYDDFRGESLFDNLLTEDENYSLVWESLRKITNTPTKDTSYISLMIDLNSKIRTNVELAEAMGDFVIGSIKNNPTGFLDMFLARDPKSRKLFSYNITHFEDPDADLIKKYKEISEDSEPKYKSAAKELLDYQMTNDN